MPIVSGEYQHQVDGIRNDVVEKWRYDVDRKSVDITFHTPSYDLTAQVQFDEVSRPKHFAYHVDDTLHGKYHVEGKQLRVERILPGNTHLDDLLVWSDDAILDLPFLSCKGHTILYLEQHGTSPTFAPILQSGDRAGDLAKKSVKRIMTDSVQIADKRYPATKYQYIRDYWLDEYGIILRGQAETYEMVLVEYKR